MTKTKKPSGLFSQGVLEDAAEISISASNDGNLYRGSIQPLFKRLAKQFPLGKGYDPLVVGPKYIGIAAMAINQYEKDNLLAGQKMIFQHKGNSTKAIARMLELKFRESALIEAGCTGPADYIREFDCDADLYRCANEF